MVPILYHPVGMEAHHQLLSLLDQHGLTLEMFRKRGRPPKGVREKRAAWVFKLPSAHKVHVRLNQSEDLAQRHGWGFEVWTEQELGDALPAAA